MAAVPVSLSGVLYDLTARTTQRVVFIGDASLSDVGVGGGPIIPPGTSPPVVWPGPGPSHPIVLPGDPSWGGGGQPPPSGAHPSHPIYYPGAHPEHPIVIPEPPTEPPDPPDEVKPPPEDGGWGWHPDYGWGYFPMGGGKPQPPGTEGSTRRSR